MTEINTIGIVKLRKATGAGLMDCKNALKEAKGNFQDAIDIIRKKGIAIANKRADRAAQEGIVLAKTSPDNKTTVMICLNCETDFVAKNERFIQFAKNILAKALIAQPTNLEDLYLLTLDDNRTIREYITEQIGIIGEKIDLSYYIKIDAPFTTNYIHLGNKLATLVGFNKVVEEQVGKDIAMQIAAMSPIAIDRNDVPKEVIDKELEIGKEKARLEGKPEKILDKIAQGRLNKFFQESTLLNQAFIKDRKITVKKYMARTGKDISITQIVRYSIAD